VTPSLTPVKSKGTASHGLVHSPPADTVDAVAQTIRSGARGVIVGRNIWQRERAEGQKVLSEIAKLTREQKFND
jgi:fructose-bisphosphate aldolase, class I